VIWRTFKHCANHAIGAKVQVISNNTLQATFDPLRTLASARARISSNAPEPRRYALITNRRGRCHEK
jgi:hypothetical protein